MKEHTTNIHYAPDKKLFLATIGCERFYLVIEGNRVGPFIQIGRNGHLRQLLLDRGVAIVQVERKNGTGH